jgi:hypothetical protein
LDLHRHKAKAICPFTRIADTKRFSLSKYSRDQNLIKQTLVKLEHVLREPPRTPSKLSAPQLLQSSLHLRATNAQTIFEKSAMRKSNYSHACSDGLVTRDQFYFARDQFCEGACAQHAAGKIIGSGVAGHLSIAL